MNVLFVANDLQHQMSLLCTVEFTVERNRTNVTSVRKHLVCPHICTLTRESTREINRMTVLTVGSCLRQTLIGSVMLVLTHKRHVHSNSRPYDCPYCGKLFKTNDELKSHVRIHTGAKPYSCRYCSECFTWLAQLKTHLLKSHSEGTWLTCKICQKKFSTSSYLKKHSLRHETVKPYVCGQCSEGFYTEHHLNLHLLVHAGYKPFCCGLCGKEFKCKRYVLQHFKRCANRVIFL